MSIRISNHSRADLKYGLILAAITMFFAAKMIWGAEIRPPKTSENVQLQTQEKRQNVPRMKKWGYRTYFHEDGTRTYESFTILGEDDDYYVGRYEHDKKNRPLRKVHKDLISLKPKPRNKGKETELQIWKPHDKGPTNSGRGNSNQH